MPFRFGEADVTINDGSFTDVAGNMRVSSSNHTDSHDVKVNSDNVSLKTYDNINGGPIILSPPSSFNDRIVSW